LEENKVKDIKKKKELMKKEEKYLKVVVRIDDGLISNERKMGRKLRDNKKGKEENKKDRNRKWKDKYK